MSSIVVASIPVDPVSTPAAHNIEGQGTHAIPVTPTTTDPSVVPPALGYEDPQNCQVNIQHMVLFHHTASGRPFNHLLVPDTLDKIVLLALEYPFLMHTLLGFSALHFSVLYPEQRSKWIFQAISLQSTALSLFDSSQGFQGDNHLSALVFSSLTAKHVLGRILRQTDQGFEALVEGCAEFLKMQMGVKAVIGGQWRSLINSSSFQKTLLRFDGATQDQRRHTLSPDLLPLTNMIDASRLDEETKDEYKAAVSDLSVCMSGDASDTADPVFAWPTMLKPSFADDLVARRPEALAILANYAVLIHRHRALWLFGSGGRYWIESISRYLGHRWHAVLRYPMSQIEETT